MDLNSYFTEFIRQNNGDTEPWMRRKRFSHNFTSTIFLIRKFLRIISGNSVVSMLNDVLTAQHKKLLFGKYKAALRHYALLYNSTTQKKKHTLLRPMRMAKFTVPECRKLGFKATHYMYRNCLKINERDKGGRNTIDREVKGNIEQHMESISHISSNRILKKQDSNVFIRETTLTEAYDLFKENYGETVSFSTFYKYVHNKFKKPYNFTDLCEYCELYREIYNEIILTSTEFGFLNVTDLDQFEIGTIEKQFLEIQGVDRSGIVSSTLKKIDNLNIIQFHKNIAQRQRETYKKMKQDEKLLGTHLLIDIDFKQKISLGEGPRQRSSEYFDRPTRGFISFGIYYVDSGTIKCLNMDLVLNSASETSFVAVTAFRHIRNQNIFKKIDKKQYIIWTDCGPHFRSNEFADFLFTDLKNDGISVTWNLFCEKHGKNSRDQHFSVISHFLKCESHVQTLTNSRQILDAVEKRQDFANKIRFESQLDPIPFYIGILENSEYQDARVRNDFKRIDHIKSFYNFFSGESGEIKSHIFSDAVNFSITVQTDLMPPGSRHFDNTERADFTRDVSIQDLINKKEFIESIISQQNMGDLSTTTAASNLQDRRTPVYCRAGKLKYKN